MRDRREAEEKINTTHGTQNMLWKEKAIEAACGAPESKAMKGTRAFPVPLVIAGGEDVSRSLAHSLLPAPLQLTPLVQGHW